jgi:integrase
MVSIDVKFQEDLSLEYIPSPEVLGDLPRLIRYYDDFHDKVRSISHLAESDVWYVHADGKRHTLNFLKIPEQCRLLFKHVLTELFDRCDPSSVATYASLLFTRPGHMARAAMSNSTEWTEYWNEHVLPVETASIAGALRSAIHSMCKLSIGQWSTDLHDLVSALRAPRKDIYKTVRNRECFVPLDQQSLIIEFFDDLKGAINRGSAGISDVDLRNACVLLLSHQYGFRPGSIARIKTQDVRIHESGAVHLSIPLIKLRDKDALRRVTRRIKHDWAALFVQFLRRRESAQADSTTPVDSFFRLSPAGVRRIIIDLTSDLLGEAWTPTDLRHTAAQRLADAGASHVSLSEFLGHASTLTANVYFDASPSQAERVNQALSLSPIYTSIANTARTKTITSNELRALPPSQQIGAVPHGIPIAGIGGCTIGQSLCAKNPVLSCYTCRRFLPVADRRVHENVVESLRPVVNMFANASHAAGSGGSQAQLTRTLRAAMQVIQGIEGETDE